MNRFRPIALSILTGFGLMLSLPSAVSAQSEAASVARNHLPGQALTLEEVHCDADRLLGFLERTEVQPLAGPATNWVNLSLTKSGDLAGVVRLAGPPAPEVTNARLVFSTNPEIPTLLRNPARPQLATISLTRNRVASDLVAADDPAAFRVIVNPTLDLVTPTPEALLEIDNLSQAGTVAKAKPGRGLEPIKARCHSLFTERDILVMRILSRIVQPSGGAADHYEVAIYRGQGVDQFRIDIYTVAVDETILGRFAARLEVSFDPFDRLTVGSLIALASCSAVGERDCTDVPFATTLTLAYPAFRGDPVRTSPFAVTGSVTSPGGGTQAAVDFEDLLGSTSWRGVAR